MAEVTGVLESSIGLEFIKKCFRNETEHEKIDLIIDTCLSQGINLCNQIAYILATARHESKRFKDLEEDYNGDPVKYFNKKYGNRLGNQLGTNDGYTYRGRGFVQLTGRVNYEKFGRALSLDLLNKPDIATDPFIAAKILAYGMKQGTFVASGKKKKDGNFQFSSKQNLSEYLTLEKEDYSNARRIVNGTDRAELIASYAENYERILEECKSGIDLAFVIDTTGSMKDDIEAVKGSANDIISTIFNEGFFNDDNRQFTSKVGINSKIGIVGFKDPGEVTKILGFRPEPSLFQSELDSPEIRKTEALNAINSISVGGGGDPKEGVYSGLRYALDGRLGNWRKGAKERRILLFGDAPPKDDALAGIVNMLSRNVASGVDISGGVRSKALSKNVFSTKVNLTRAAVAEPISVEIFTVIVGQDSDAQTAFQRIASENSGRAFTAASADEVVSVLLQAINEQDLGIAPSPIDFNRKLGIRRNGTARNDEFIGTNKNDILDGRSGNDRLDGKNSNDRLLGNKGKDTLLGGSGRDWLLGGNDKDTMMGGSGDDILEGGVGKDVLSGEQGRDLFVFNSLIEKGDIINDFDGNSDLIDLRPIFAQPQFSGSTPFSRLTQFVQVVQTGKSTRVLIDADGSGIGATFTNLVTLKNFSATNISSEDFVIL
jgi:Chitinase class I/RTX calcium-binding nonapeptide repeat (4 copies)/von Willebrand factor type A domain